MIHIQNLVYYSKFRYIWTYSRPDIFSHFVVYLEICVTLAYSEPCHIQNNGIFRTQDSELCQGIFWHIKYAA